MVVKLYSVVSHGGVFETWLLIFPSLDRCPFLLLLGGWSSERVNLFLCRSRRSPALFSLNWFVSHCSCYCWGCTRARPPMPTAECMFRLGKLLKSASGKFCWPKKLHTSLTGSRFTHTPLHPDAVSLHEYLFRLLEKHTDWRRKSTLFSYPNDT